MNAVKTLGVVLLVCGVLGLVYGSFSYTREVQEAKIGSLVISVKEKRAVNVPIWLGVGGIVLGSAFLVTAYRVRPS